MMYWTVDKFRKASLLIHKSNHRAIINLETEAIRAKWRKAFEEDWGFKEVCARASIKTKPG